MAHRIAGVRAALGVSDGANARRSTRATLVSTSGARRSNAKLATAPAVYGPIPGSRRSSTGSEGSTPGPPSRVTSRDRA